MIDLRPAYIVSFRVARAIWGIPVSKAKREVEGGISFRYWKQKELGLDHDMLHNRPLMSVIKFNSHNFAKKNYVCIIYIYNTYYMYLCIGIYIYRDMY